jgi:dipeptidyl aminopeptidase/acylaminoacyl peptidase
MRVKFAYLLAHVLGLVFVGSASCLGEDSRVTVQDCVQVRYINGAWMNRQGTRVAYLVKSPNLRRNVNDYQLYLKDVGSNDVGPGRSIASGETLSIISWSGDGKSLAILEPSGTGKAVVLLNVESGKRETLTQPGAIIDYSLSDSGDVMVYAVEDETPRSQLEAQQSQDRVAKGYRVELGGNAEALARGLSLFSRYRTAGGSWSRPERISIHDPFTHRSLAHFPPLSMPRLSLSPDGRRLLFNYMTDIPDQWRQSPWTQFLMRAGNTMEPIMVLYDLKSGQTTLALNVLNPDSTPQWFRDSRSFLVNAHSPVGSIWEQEDVQDHRIAGPDANMFWVNAASGKVEQVFKRVPFHHEGALFWRQDGDVIIQAHGGTVLRLHRSDGEWREDERVEIPRTEKDRFWSLMSTGSAIVGIHEAVDVPPDLFSYAPGDRSVRILTDLNPALKSERFAPSITVHWTTTEGLDLSGLLFLPPDYLPGKRYPLVIQTKGDQGLFTCDSGSNHEPAFAPQPMANAGMMYLIRIVPENFKFQDEQAKQPKGYPGHIGEAVLQMDIWNSAVKALTDQGLVNPEEIGIIGFSRTGWYVEYMLAHSSFHYAAATAADNTAYSLSEYWLSPGIDQDIEAMYDGPPFGSTRQNWLDYSVSDNLEKIRTPLLLEEMGYGVRDDSQDSTPNGLAIAYEVFKGLSRLEKPVDLYYYPDEGHQPDHPKARLSTLQRNVDWYRFWLQGYEDPSPEKREQYALWRQLRKLQNANARKQGCEPSCHPAAIPNHDAALGSDGTGS